jgi:uncharacterized membrane protein YjfL (UPF0719 family)
MDWNTFFFASYEMIISIIFSLLTIFVTQLFLNKTLLDSKIEGSSYVDNVAVAIFAGTIIISVLILVNSSILPAVDTLRAMVLAAEKITWRMVGVSLLYFLFFFIITIFFSIIILYLAIQVYFFATRSLDELQELRHKNISVAIMMSMVVMGIALFVRPSLSRFISSLVHYEKFQDIAIKEKEQNIPSQNNGNEMIVPLKKIEPKKK